MNRTYFLLLLSQMGLDDLSGATVTFFRKIYPSLTSIPHLSVKEMSELAYMTNTAAHKHVFRLGKHGYLIRKHHRAWKLNTNALRNPDLLSLMRSSKLD